MSDTEISRRLVLGGLALLLSGCTQATGTSTLSLALPDRPPPDPRFERQRVPYNGSESPGTIVVSISERYLYAVEENGMATRYGVAVGEQGLTFTGKATIGNKAEWPSWTPTTSMIERKPPWHSMPTAFRTERPTRLVHAPFIYQGGRDTLFRLHGTNEPWLIGTAVSNGCIRLTNDDIVALYDRTPIGATVVVA